MKAIGVLFILTMFMLLTYSHQATQPAGEKVSTTTNTAYALACPGSEDGSSEDPRTA